MERIITVVNYGNGEQLQILENEFKSFIKSNDFASDREFYDKAIKNIRSELQNICPGVLKENAQKVIEIINAIDSIEVKSGRYSALDINFGGATGSSSGAFTYIEIGGQIGNYGANYFVLGNDDDREMGPGYLGVKAYRSFLVRGNPNVA